MAGVSVEDRPMIAETHHKWILENKPDERFVRMKKMVVAQTKLFQLISGKGNVIFQVKV